MNATSRLFAAQILGGAFLAACLGGCAARPRTAPAEYHTVAPEPNRDSHSAQAENAQALGLIESGKFDEAEKRLKRALTADVMFGPAHNNLGRVYFQQGKYYLAAWEFQYAAKLMPNRPEPLSNLGLVFESVGKLDDAVQMFEQARAQEPDNAEFIGNAARARVRRGDPSEQVRPLLQELVLKDSRPQWVNWARQRLALMLPQ